MTEGDDHNPDSRGQDPRGLPLKSDEPAPASGPARVVAPLPPVRAYFADPPLPANDPQPVSPDAIHAYLSRREVLASLLARARSLVPRQHAEDLVQDTAEAALSAKTRPGAEAAIPAWVNGVMDMCRRKRLRKTGRRMTYEGPSIEDPDAYVAPEPDSEPEDLKITPWLERVTEHNPRDRQTLDMLKEKARDNLTYAELAARHDTTEAALCQRVSRFVRTYRRRRVRFLAKRAGVILLVFAAVVLLLYILLGGFNKAGPPEPLPLRPVPVVTVRDVPFEPAAPSGVPSAAPRQAPQPRADDKGPPSK